MSWWVYVVECADATLYTGVAMDVERRVDEHNSSPRGARYTRARRPVTLAAAWAAEDRSLACKAEYALKKLSRDEKLALVAGDLVLAEQLALGKRYEAGDQDD